MKSKLVCAGALLVLCSIITPYAAYACGPFSVDPAFSLTRHPDYPLKDYASGNTGIVPSSFGRMSLYLFYRQLNGLPLSGSEQKQYVAALNHRISPWVDENGKEKKEQAQSPANDPHLAWLEARKKLSGDSPSISVDKRPESEYYSYTNCLEDAFRNASATLEQRLAKYGNGEPVKKWLAGQDAVFSNCSTNAALPEPAADNDPEWLKKDRAYQTAAAYFYRAEFEESRKALRAISADKDSPWSDTARLVLARTYIRQANLIDDTEADDEAAPAANAPASNASSPQIKSASQKKAEKDEYVAKAADALNEIIKDPAMSGLHSSARRLSNLVRFRSNPKARLQELGIRLADPAVNENLRNDLIDYIWLLDRTEGASAESGEKAERDEAERSGKELDYTYEYRLKLKHISDKERGADLTDWLFTYQVDDGFEHAYAKWKANGKPHWLVAAISKASFKDARAAELIGAASEFTANSPAFATARYHQVRLLLDAGKRDAAKALLDEVFTARFSTYGRSTQNKFFSERMVLAKDVEEFLKYAKRRPAAFVMSDDANEGGEDIDKDSDLKPWKDREMFDEDAIAYINEKMPLSVVRQAALSKELPDHLKKAMIEAAWIKGFILGESAMTAELLPHFQKLSPEYSGLVKRYSAAKTPAEREAAGLLLILRNPATQPYVESGITRATSDRTAIDSIRGNWWCVEDANTPKEYNYAYGHWGFNYPTAYPEFLTAADKAAGQAEQKRLVAMGASATLLTRRAIAFATANPKHPDTPELLHLGVRSTRYGCKDKDTLRASKSAFDILHRRYPRSPWTAKTPYYFGERSE